MKKTALLLVLLVSFSYGYTYNKLLLKAQASIFPKIIMLDKKVDRKLINGEIVYVIVYEKDDYYTALEIKEFIRSNYKDNMNRYSYRVDLVEHSEFSDETQATAIYALNSDKHIHKIAHSAIKKGIISFAYDINYLKYGILFSLMLEKSTVIYLNKEDIDTKRIDFVDSLYQIVNFIEKNGS